MRTLALFLCLSALPLPLSAEPDWQALYGDAKTHLTAMIRLDTSNPPGNEILVSSYIAGVLEKEGIPYEVFESSPGRANLAARLKGNGSKKPVLIMAHIDVVGVERDKWSADPFAAEEKDGYLYGRGAIDDKGMAAAALAVMTALKKSTEPMSRDVILLASADEESGGKYGIRYMVENHWEAIEAEWGLNEGGSFKLEDGEVKSVAIQAAEKLYHDIRLTAKGTPGHASAPFPDNAIYTLSRALFRLENYQPPVRLNAVTRAFFEGVRALEVPKFQKAIEDLLSPEKIKQKRGASVLSQQPKYGSMLRDSIAPTILSGGFRANVIPSEVWVNLNCRLLPDSKTEDFLKDIKSVIGDDKVEIQVQIRPEEPTAPAMPVEGGFYEILSKVGSEMFPKAVVAPYMSTGATDSEHLRKKGMLVYGVGFPLAAEDEARMHGNDERIPLESLSLGTKYLYRVIEEAAR